MLDSVVEIQYYDKNSGQTIYAQNKLYEKMNWRNIFKSRRQINRENQEKGKDWENCKKKEYELKGCKVDRTGKGHDFKATGYNWRTGKNEIEYIECKDGPNARLTPLQKKKRRHLGDQYIEERRNSGPCGIEKETIRGITKKPSDSFWGSGSSGRTRKASSKKIEDSFWSSGSSGRTGKTRNTFRI